MGEFAKCSLNRSLDLIIGAEIGKDALARSVYDA